jgi:signal transduction histidine kinase
MKFTPEGEIRVSAVRSGEELVTFSVVDTGIGIAREHHAAIFQDFTQVDSPLQKKWRGTGLGLSLSKKVAELLGGSVAMESEPGKGSTFSVTIPIHFQGDAETTEPAKPTLGLTK